MPIEQKYSYISAFQWIYSRLQPHRKKQFWILFAGMSLTAFFETFTLGIVAFFASAITDPDVVLSSKYIRFIKQIYSPDILNTAKELIIASGFIMVFVVGVKNCVKAIVSYWITRFSVGLEAYFGEILLNGFLRLPYKWHLTRNTADLINAVNWRVYLGSGFFQPYLNIFNSLLMLLVMLVALFCVNPIVSSIVLIVIGSSAFFIYIIIRKQIDKISVVARDYHLTLNKDTTMAIHGIKDVKISQKEKQFVSKFLDKAIPLSKISAVQGFYSQSPVLILETIGLSMLYLAICVLLFRTNISTAYITGTMALLAVTAWKALPAVSQILRGITGVRKSLPYIASQMEYITFIEHEGNTSHNISIKSFDLLKTIRFDHVDFYYEEGGLKILHDLNFEIQKGETIGIIGPSGSGKSTLVDLLIGLLEPVNGSIKLDDKVLNRDLLPSWLTITGYVSQTPYIFDGTLADNIAFGISSNDIDRDKVRKCCTMASMDDFIHNLPDDIDSFIGERGIKLSGGQQQRVAIARALYNKPEVLIFDEATSALDTKSEKSILKTIYSFKGKQTLVIIAHRLSTVKDCDRIIWLEKGRVKMIGKPEKILGVYDQGRAFRINRQQNKRAKDRNFGDQTC